jgi:tetratricopeptide (TPR) repeat protein
MKPGFSSDLAIKTAFAVAFAVPMFAISPAPANAAKAAPVSISGQYLSARHADNQKDAAAAAKLYKNVLATDPKNATLLQRTFFALVASRQTGNAVKIAERLIAINPRDSVAGIALALDQMRKGDFPAALKKLGKASRSRLNALVIPLVEAWAQVGAGKTDQGLKALNALDRRKAYRLFKNYHMALISDLAGKNGAAEKAYQKSIAQRSGPSLRNIEIYGSFLERTGRAKEALPLYRGILERDIDNPLMLESVARVEKGGKASRHIENAVQGTAEALHGVASVLVPQNGIEQALIYLNLSLFLKPEFPAAQSLLGGIYENQRRWKAANKIYASISLASAYGWNARIRMASNLDRIDKTDEAVSILRKLAKDYPTRLDALTSLGSILRARKRFDEAVGVYNEAISRLKEPRALDWHLYYSRGVSFERRNIWDKAEADFLKALELQPEQPTVLNYLGYSWVEKNMHLEKAQKMIERAVELRPRDGYIVDSLGWVLYRLGDYEAAVVKLERAVALRPEDPIINEHLGDALWQAGRRLEAGFQWRHSLALKPDAKNAATLKLKIEKGLDAVPSGNAK